MTNIKQNQMERNKCCNETELHLILTCRIQAEPKAHKSFRNCFKSITVAKILKRDIYFITYNNSIIDFLTDFHPPKIPLKELGIGCLLSAQLFYKTP